MQEAAVATVQQLNAGLEAIGDHPRCRLPRAEIRKRLSLFATKLSESTGSIPAKKKRRL
jgi:plasmid stabilization system protein ParE